MFKCGTSGPGISNFRSQKFRPKIFSVLAEMNPIRSLEFDKAQQSPPGISSRQCMFLFVFFLKAHLLPLSTTSRRALNTRTRAKTSNIPLVVYGTALVTKPDEYYLFAVISCYWRQICIQSMFLGDEWITHHIMTAWSILRGMVMVSPSDVGNESMWL